MLSKEKLIDEAKRKANNFIVPLKDNRDKADRNRSLTSSQLRKFFGEVKRLHMKYNILLTSIKKNEKNKDNIVKKNAFKEIETMLALIVANARYTYSRGKIPKGFYEFLETEIKAIDNAEKFEDFVKYFEAVVGHYYFIAKEKGLKLD